METNTDLIRDTKRRMLVKYPRFGSEIAKTNIEFSDNFSTAATDGKNIYVNPNYFKSLNENDRLYMIAHEVMHIKFMHMFRLQDKNGVKRDLELWNIATDAIINANLERDGFKIKEGYVNMPEALNYSAEEFYQKLLEEKEKKEQEQEKGEEGTEENQSQDSKQDGNQTSNEGNSQDSDHSLWEEAFKEYQNSKNGQKQKKDKEQENSEEPEQNKKQDKNSQKQSMEQQDVDTYEKEEFEENRKEKRERFKNRRERTEKYIINANNGSIGFGNIGKSREEIDWKLLIRREVEKNETIWSQRRSIAENNYAYRLEENDLEEDSETEVMIDVSGSVDLDLVRSFLRQLKPLLNQSKLKVGCFNTRVYDFVEVKKLADIDKLRFPMGGGTNLDIPVRAFTKKREINKIIFTDGYPGIMPREDLKKENVIWLVYGNRDFHPCCGKVINITEKQLQRLHQIKSSSRDDFSR